MGALSVGLDHESAETINKPLTCRSSPPGSPAAGVHETKKKQISTRINNRMRTTMELLGEGEGHLRGLELKWSEDITPSLYSVD